MLHLGVGSAIAAIMGLGTGVTTYAENIALMHITKVTSLAVFEKFALLTGLLIVAIEHQMYKDSSVKERGVKQEWLSSDPSTIIHRHR